MKSPGKKLWFSLVIFILVFGTHFDSPNIESSDSRWVIPVTFSILKEHTTNLDQYRTLIEWNASYGIDTINNHLYTIYPIGTSIIILPFVYVIDKFCAKALGIDIYTIGKTNKYNGLELLLASFFVAITAVFIFLTAQLILNSYFQSTLITLIFSFCTSAWSTASRALWQHCPSMLVLTIALYLLIKAKEKPHLVIWTGMLLAFSYVIRPTDFIPVLFISLYVFINYRTYFIRYLLASLVIAIPFFIYNYSVYGALLTPYYLGHNQGHAANYAEAILGNLISPGRGLFVFSPVLLFSVVGMVYKLRTASFKSLDFFLAITLIFYLLFFSWMRSWWAGWCFGPRYFTDVLPYLIYFLIGSFEWINKKRLNQKLLFVTVLIPLVVISFYINYKGATDWATYEWNYKPNYIAEHTERLWQWNDLQFLR